MSTTIKPIGDYSRQEIAWYRAQMTEIDNFIEEKKEACYTVIVEYSQRMDALLIDPTSEF